MHNVFFIYRNRLICDALSNLINEIQTVKIIGDSNISNFKSSSAVISKCEIILLEIDFPDQCVLEGIYNLRKLFPEQKIFVIGSNGDIRHHHIFDIISTGISAYILKDCSKIDLINGFHKILHAEKYICTKLLAPSFNIISGNQSSIVYLTKREKEVLSFLVSGLSNLEVAEILSLSESTIKSHRKNLMEKLNASNIINLISNALSAKIISKDNLPFCKSCY